MRRRTFIAAGLGAVSGMATWVWCGSDPAATIAMVLRRRLDYLTLDPEGVQRYARDLLAKNGLSSTRIHVLSALRPLYTRASLSGGHNALAFLLRHGEDRIVAGYLISSDFFVAGADVSRVVRYERLLDGTRACANPFARRPA